ncbi:unnamed protein product [Sphagnum troendelagicum]|uniref:Initiation factor eIF2 gamma C-terminal domain-containing protein n=1 Tax=Sphagnum troendelagicum TaxID=128251 RepID=A0ABP0TBB8_9BRYO
MIVIRSFNVNRPGAEVEEIKGAVAGGSILRVLGEVGELPDVFVELEVNFFLLHQRHRKARQGVKAKKIEVLMINIWDCVIAVKNDLAKLHLTIPVCTSKGEKVAPSR